MKLTTRELTALTGAVGRALENAKGLDVAALQSAVQKIRAGLERRSDIRKRRRSKQPAALPRDGE